MIGWYFIAVLTVVLLAWGCRQISECETFSINTEQDEAKAEYPAPFPAFNKTKKRKNGWCDYPKKPKDLVALLTLGAVAYYTWLTQKEVNVAQQQVGISIAANKISQDALIDENRPWLKVTIPPTDFIWFPETTFGGMSPPVEVQNVGHSVALHAQAVVSAYLVGSADTLDQAQKKACAILTNNGVRGDILFPGDTVDLSHQSLGTVGFGIDEAQIEKLRPNITTNKNSFIFMIYGCVDYTFANPNTHFQTFFAYQVWRIIKRSQPPNGATSEFVVGQNVPSENILLTPTFAGNYAN